jgi:gluconate 5-dehydrogenase
MATDWLGIAGRRVVVLGTGGLGEACISAFVAGSADVVAFDLSPEPFVHSFCPPATASGGGRLAVHQADLSTAEGCRAAIDRAIERLGGIDAFVHAVGVNDRTSVLELTDDSWESVLRVNLSSAFWSGQAVGRCMVRQGHGSLVFFSSVSGLLAHANHGPYAASKGGLNQLVRVMAREWAPTGVTVNAVAPAYTDTPLTQDYLDRDGHRDELARLVPAGRLGTPEDVVGPVLFLSSPRSAFVTGQVLYVDGGRTLV